MFKHEKMLFHPVGVERSNPQRLPQHQVTHSVITVVRWCNYSSTGRTEITE